MFQRQDSL